MKNKIVYVVEDDPSIRSDLTEILENEGYEAKAFNNGKQGLDHLNLAADLPVLIILDLMMPVMNGYEFLDGMFKNPKFTEIPVLVLSADGQSDPKLFKGRVRAFMKKPIDLDPFVELVKSLI